MNDSRSNERRRVPPKGGAGFTLVEVLVVLAVVAVLAAILMSVVKSSRRSADRVRGATIMRNIGQAIQLYTAEHNGTLPGPLTPSVLPRRGASDPGKGQELAGRIIGYLGAADAYANPNDIVKGFANPSVLAKSADPMLPHYYLFFNLRDAQGRWSGPSPWGYPGHGQYPQPMRAVAIERPAQQIVMKDADVRLQNSDRPSGWPPPRGLQEPIYDKARNVLFFDGHVEAEPIQ